MIALAGAWPSWRRLRMLWRTPPLGPRGLAGSPRRAECREAGAGVAFRERVQRETEGATPAEEVSPQRARARGGDESIWGRAPRRGAKALEPLAGVVPAPHPTGPPSRRTRGSGGWGELRPVGRVGSAKRVLSLATRVGGAASAKAYTHLRAAQEEGRTDISSTFRSSTPDRRSYAMRSPAARRRAPRPRWPSKWSSAARRA